MSVASLLGGSRDPRTAVRVRVAVAWLVAAGLQACPPFRHEEGNVPGSTRNAKRARAKSTVSQGRGAGFYMPTT